MIDYLKELVLLTIGGIGMTAFFALLVVFAPIIALFTVDK